MVELTAGDAMIGDTVTDAHVTLTVNVTGGMGDRLRFVKNGTAMAFIDVDADPFVTTLDVDAPPGDEDDRYRAVLYVGTHPEVVTSHLWIAATGMPPDMPPSMMAASSGGCGCRVAPGASGPASGTGGSAGVCALAALAALAVFFARRRRSP